MPKQTLKFAGVTPVDSKTMESSFGGVYRFPAGAAKAAFETPLRFLDTRNPVITITGANLILSDNVTKGENDYWTLSIYNRGPAGAGTDVLATINASGTEGTLAKLIRNAFTVDATKLIKDGDLITLVLASTGSSGLIIPSFAVELNFKQ